MKATKNKIIIYKKLFQIYKSKKYRNFNIYMEILKYN